MSKTIISKVIGELTQDESFAEWWIKPNVAIPFFDGQSIPITFMNFNPVADQDFISEADESLKSFLSKGYSDRLQMSDLVFQNFELFRQEGDYPYWSNDLRKLSVPIQIWSFFTNGH